MYNGHIAALDRNLSSHIQAKLDNKTKPLGALGQLESLALQLALIQRSETITIKKPTVLVFAGDHGVAQQGISIAPSEVTSQMVANFIHGGAAINCFCRANQLTMAVIDAGIKMPLEPHPASLINQSVGRGTADLSQTAAMTQQQLQQCFSLGEAVTNRFIDDGSNVLAFGEMGIGNTTSAAAILAALCDLPVADCVGRGTGITDAQLALKTALINTALNRFSERDPYTLLQQLGGFEIAQICAAMLTAAQRQVTIVVDGFIVTAAALLAHAIAPAVVDYMVFAHCSDESGHRLMLDHLAAKPLLNLQLRLGEGTGAALAIPLLRASAAFYNEMATFESAGVTV